MACIKELKFASLSSRGLAKYSLDGKLIIVGMMKGQVYFYSAVNGLRYFTQIACRNCHGSKKTEEKLQVCNLDGFQMKNPALTDVSRAKMPEFSFLGKMAVKKLLKI